MKHSARVDPKKVEDAMYQQSSRNSSQASLLRIATVAVIIMLGGMGVFVTAQEPKPKTDQASPPTSATSAETDIDKLRKLVAQLSAENARLKAENAKLEKYRQVDYVRELLLKEEQRVESLQRELTDSFSREASLQKRLDEIESQLRPGRVEESRAGIGSMKPEVDREDIQRQLSNEKHRIQGQIEQLQLSRPRLQAAIQTAEASIATLRQRLRDAVRTAGLTNPRLP
jgi:chromosome segregation ATPase